MVRRHMRVYSDGLCACEAYGRPVVKEVRGTMEGDSIVTGLLPKDFEEFDRLTMGLGVCEVSAENLRGYGPRTEADIWLGGTIGKMMLFFGQMMFITRKSTNRLRPLKIDDSIDS